MRLNALKLQPLVQWQPHLLSPNWRLWIDYSWRHQKALCSVRSCCVLLLFFFPTVVTAVHTTPPPHFVLPSIPKYARLIPGPSVYSEPPSKQMGGGVEQPRVGMMIYAFFCMDSLLIFSTLISFHSICQSVCFEIHSSSSATSASSFSSSSPSFSSRSCGVEPHSEQNLKVLRETCQIETASPLAMAMGMNERDGRRKTPARAVEFETGNF